MTINDLIRQAQELSADTMRTATAVACPPAAKAPLMAAVETLGIVSQYLKAAAYDMQAVRHG